MVRRLNPTLPMPRVLRMRVARAIIGSGYLLSDEEETDSFIQARHVGILQGTERESERI